MELEIPAVWSSDNGLPFRAMPSTRHHVNESECRSCNLQRNPMYAKFAYIGVVWGVNVSIYGKHEVSGI